MLVIEAISSTTSLPAPYRETYVRCSSVYALCKLIVQSQWCCKISILLRKRGRYDLVFPRQLLCDTLERPNLNAAHLSTHRYCVVDDTSTRVTPFLVVWVIYY